MNKKIDVRIKEIVQNVKKKNRTVYIYIYIYIQLFFNKDVKVIQWKRRMSLQQVVLN